MTRKEKRSLPAGAAGKAPLTLARTRLSKSISAGELMPTCRPPKLSGAAARRQRRTVHHQFIRSHTRIAAMIALRHRHDAGAADDGEDALARTRAVRRRWSQGWCSPANRHRAGNRTRRRAGSAPDCHSGASACAARHRPLNSPPPLTGQRSASSGGLLQISRRWFLVPR